MRKLYLFLLLSAVCCSANAYSLCELRSKIQKKESNLYNQEESQQRFFESFEAWDGQTADWLPDGWSEIISDESYVSSNDGVFTWHVGKDMNNKPLPVDGKFYANIYYAYKLSEEGKTIDLPQDEWLITPAFDIIAGDVFKFSLGYSPMFLFDMNNENINWSKMDFVNRLPSTTMKIYIREIDEISSEVGEWVEILNIYDEWVNTSLEELFNTYSNSEFFRYEIDLSDYSGKSIQVAFRYVGMYGNTMELDAISIENNSQDGIESINADNELLTVYGIDGVELLRNATTDDLNVLSKGIYIINGKKVVIR